MMDYAKSYHICQMAYSDCLRFWRMEGEPDEKAFVLAKKDVEGITTNPYSPNGEELNAEAKADFLNGK